MASGLISVGDFHLFLARNGEPGVVAIILQRAELRSMGLDLEDGAFMAEIIQQVAGNTPKQLVISGNRRQSDYVYWVDTERRNIRVDSSEIPVIFNGKISEIRSWVDNPLAKYVRKVVQFRYRNGSKPGALRTIRVEKVNPSARGRGSLEGIDLDKVDLMAWKEGKSEGYRKYNIDSIQGEIKVLN